MFSYLKRSSELQGVLIMILTCFMFATVNVLIKPVAQTVDPFIMVTYRSFFSILFVLPLVIFLFKSGKASKPTKMNAFKAFTDFMSLPAWNLAIYFLKIGDAVAITYLTPLISAFLAIIFLKEKLTPKKWMCLLLGLVGAYIILSPNSSGYNYYSIFALLSCLCWAIANVMTKHLANIKQHPAIIVFYGNIIVFGLSMPFFLFNGRMLTSEELGLVMLMSFFACGGHFCLAWAYTKTKMTNLLPIDYSRLLFSVAYGYIFFGEIIGINTMIGTAIILGASIYLGKQIRRTNKEEAKLKA